MGKLHAMTDHTHRACTNRSVTLPTRPLVVGSVATIDELAGLQPEGLLDCCDLLEIRLDGMTEHMSTLSGELDKLTQLTDCPLLFTARGPEEGGIIDLSAEERSQLLLAVADHATWIDVELSAYEDLSATISDLREKGIGLILSYHNFEQTPTEAQMQSIVDKAHTADIVKLALRHHQASDFNACIGILQSNDRPMSMMGMGALAPVSRMLYAQHGSLLNYGYLGDAPTAPGQWPAKLLKQAIAKLDPV